MTAPVRITGGTAGLRVGVTMFLRDGDQSLWENGIHQNGLFLLMLLARSSVVAQSFLIGTGPGLAAAPAGLLGQSPVPVIDLATARHSLDVVIELGAQVELDWARDFTAAGGRIVSMRVANDRVIDAERMAFGLPPGMVMDGVPYAEIWTLPAFAADCGAYYAAGLRAPVRVMPHLWSPVLIDRAAADAGRGPLGYRPGRARWRIAVLEPNICTVKTGHVPLLAADMAHRRDPKAIAELRVFNALQMKTHPGFVAFARSLDLVRQGLATFEGRYPLFDILGPVCDAVLSHHDRNAQNYLHYETLHGGFPLIHNSAMLGGCGYRYADFDPEDGGLALLQAIRSHDRALDHYRAEARRFLRTLDPEAEANVAAFDAALAHLQQERIPA